MCKLLACPGLRCSAIWNDPGYPLLPIQDQINPEHGKSTSTDHVISHQHQIFRLIGPLTTSFVLPQKVPVSSLWKVPVFQSPEVPTELMRDLEVQILLRRMSSTSRLCVYPVHLQIHLGYVELEASLSFLNLEDYLDSCPLSWSTRRSRVVL